MTKPPTGLSARATAEADSVIVPQSNKNRHPPPLLYHHLLLYSFTLSLNILYRGRVHWMFDQTIKLFSSVHSDLPLLCAVEYHVSG